MKGTAYIIISPALGRCNILLDPLWNNCIGLLSNQQGKQGSELHV